MAVVLHRGPSMRCGPEELLAQVMGCSSWGLYLCLLDDEHMVWSLGCPLGWRQRWSGTAMVPERGDMGLRKTGCTFAHE